MGGSERHRYDVIGVGYERVRRPDPRIADALHRHLGDARTVLNVGAGTGSYEPADRRVVALEPSELMVDRRPDAAAPCVRGVAEELPFGTGAFDGAMAVLTVHHWRNSIAGLGELRRVVIGPIVVLSFDREIHNRQWLVTDYFTPSSQLDPDTPAPGQILTALGGQGTVEPLPIPHDCTDGFAHAYWRRPEAYLDPAVRRGISALARLDPDSEAVGVARLRSDLATGRWREQHGDLVDATVHDAGYRIVVAH